MIGTKLAHYEIASHLGSGGMGEVYQANDPKLGRSVAIKLLPEAFAHDAERAARFEREARVLAALNHPNIAAIYGIEDFRGRKFLVMELARGETLAEPIQRGPMPIEDAIVIARQIADGLESAHEHGIVHRDLKPANIKVTPQGQVKSLAGEAADMTATNAGIICRNCSLHEALPLAEKSYAVAPYDRLSTGTYAGLLSRAGQQDKANEVLQTLGSGTAYGTSSGLALYDICRGEIESAADWFEKAIDERYPFLLALLQSSIGEPLRASSRWLQLCASLNLPIA